MNKLYKILIIVFVFLLATISAYGYFHNANKKIDDKDYSSLIVDEDYDNEFEYIEERIIFDSKVEDIIAKMSDEEKVAQVFFVTPEQLLESKEEFCVSFDEDMKKALDKYPVGGLIYSSNNIKSIEQIRKLLNDTSNYLSNTKNIDLLQAFTSTSNLLDLSDYLEDDKNITANEIAMMGDDSLVNEYINEKIKELKTFGFNTYLDLNINLNNDKDNFGLDPFYASDIVSMVVNSLKENKVITFCKTFPQKEDTNLTIDELTISDFMTLQAAIDTEVDGVIISNNLSKAVTGNSNTPVILSENSFDVLRARLGFNGICLTSDSSNVDYSKEEILDLFIAGNDMILRPKDFKLAYDTLLEAVKNEKISPTRINNAIGRIISHKLNLEY